MAARDSGTVGRPSVDGLVRRLADTPADFLRDPAVVGRDGIAVAALVSDVVLAHGGEALDVPAARAFVGTDDPVTRNWLRTVAVATWLVSDPSLAAADDVGALLRDDLSELAAHVAADDLVTDPDRREELARRCLHALGLQPDGETEAQATDRLAALDSAERARVLAATADAERRAAEVREAMHAQAAAEAAAKVSRE